MIGDHTSPLLALKGICKSFPGVRALEGVSFDVRHGEVHALMGENGAGKSTLIKVLTGVHRPDSGQMLLEGQPIFPTSPLDALRIGISTVYQEVNLAPNLSVAENVCLGRESRGLLGIRWREMQRRAEAALERLGVRIDVRAPLGSYPIALQQMAAIARALDVSARVLVLDEPTSSLDRKESAQLFDAMRRLKGQGIGIVFITHFLDQVYEVSDRITVLRNGRLVGAYDAVHLTKLELVSKMIGRDAESIAATRREFSDQAPGNVPLLEAESIGRRGAVEGVAQTVAGGEVLGLAGLLGSGRTETLRLLFGADPYDSGALRIDGRPVRRYNCRKAIRAGFGLCPEDRKTDGILPDLSVRENIVIVLQAKRGWLRRLSKSGQDSVVQELLSRLRIATPDAERPIKNLSGGNQQKALLARWLAANPRLLMLDEPTRGIDIGTKFEIAEIIEKLRREGMAFVLVSSELEEVVRSATKVCVLRDRKAVGNLLGAEATENRIMEMIAGGGS